MGTVNWVWIGFVFFVNLCFWGVRGENWVCLLFSWVVSRELWVATHPTGRGAKWLGGLSVTTVGFILGGIVLICFSFLFCFPLTFILRRVLYHKYGQCQVFLAGFLFNCGVTSPVPGPRSILILLRAGQGKCLAFEAKLRAKNEDDRRVCWKKRHKAHGIRHKWWNRPVADADFIKSSRAMVLTVGQFTVLSIAYFKINGRYVLQFYPFYIYR